MRLIVLLALLLTTASTAHAEGRTTMSGYGEYMQWCIVESFRVLRVNGLDPTEPGNNEQINLRCQCEVDNLPVEGTPMTAEDHQKVMNACATEAKADRDAYTQKYAERYMQRMHEL